MKNYFLTRRFYISFASIILILVLSYIFPLLSIPVKLLLLLFIGAIIYDRIKLEREIVKLTASRTLSLKLSLADSEEINYTVTSDSDLILEYEIYDEFPYQFQIRDKLRSGQLEAKQKIEFVYEVFPYERGEYDFGMLHLYVTQGPFKFLQRRKTFIIPFKALVVPSIKELKRNEMKVFSKIASLSGIRRIRRRGQNDEFEHIQPYNQGDDIRSINWKATARANALMVDHFQDTRHQEVYCILDKGRSMKMPFNGMTLLDYSINSILSLSNIILRKYDYAGLISFSDIIDTRIKATSNKGQLERISDSLYNETTGFKESNFELLLYATRNTIKRRSIWIFFTNFETPYDLDRQLPYLKIMNRRHLVVIVIFINTVLQDKSEMTCETKTDIYQKTFAERSIMEKEIIKEKLQRNGIQAILTRPEKLSIKVINKYLELKAKRMT